MKEVLELIEQKKKEFAKLPFFEFLGNESIDPRERVAWAPCLAYFAMMFKDLNAYVLRKEPTDNLIQKMINHHTYEDGGHWRWFLEDIKRLGFEESLNFGDSLRFLWGDETKKTRQLCYNLSGLCVFEEDVLIKLAIIEAIEATGDVALPYFAKLGEELQKITSQRYYYFHASHAKVETGHILCGLDSDQIEKFLIGIELSAEQNLKALNAVEIIFNSYSECMNEMMAYLEKHSYEQKYREYTCVLGTAIA
ncbi:MAG: hypothetical protein AAF915_10505 [Cyanobacteria bacterium P01_D01_bin.50]